MDQDLEDLPRLNSSVESSGCLPVVGLHDQDSYQGHEKWRYM